LLGWFQGKAEVGARALGARSILADPSSPKMKDLINEKVKFRENWRPFAPSISTDLAHLIFNDTIALTPFMITTAQVKQEACTLIPSATHIDSTARPQLVSKDTLPRYWKLLMEFYEIKKSPQFSIHPLILKGSPSSAAPKMPYVVFLVRD
jgi:carbamoyltransferase